MNDKEINEQFTSLWGRLHAFEFLFTKLVITQLKDVPNEEAIAFIKERKNEYMKEAGAAKITDKDAETTRQIHLNMLASIDLTMKRILGYLGDPGTDSPNYERGKTLH